MNAKHAKTAVWRSLLAFVLVAGLCFPNLRPLAFAATGGGSSTLTTSNAANEEPATDKIFGEVNDISPAPESGEGGNGVDSSDTQKPAVGDTDEGGDQQPNGNGEETPETPQPSNPENQPQGEVDSAEISTGETVSGSAAIATAPKFATAAAPLSASADNADEGISAQADDAGDFTVTGGTAGTDYNFDASTGILHILSSKALTIGNKTPATATSHSIQVDAGVYANLIFNNVNITAKSPLEIQTGATANIILLDRTSNRLVSNFADFKIPGIHCGTGSNLIIDDQVVNVDTSGNPITPKNGKIPAGTTYVANDGKTHNSTGDYLTLLDSKNPGTLYVHGGGQGAAIGGAYGQDGGNMTFNGGNITVLNGKGPKSAGASGGEHGAGIGGGGMAAGTSPSEWITFNGGSVHTEAAYHGAGVGGGWNNSTPGAYVSQHPAGTGNIRINGGYIRSIGGEDGNGFGRGCYGGQVKCDNRDYAIVITGGTMIPSGGTNLGDWGNDIGGGSTGMPGGGYVQSGTYSATVAITGGSIKVSTTSGGRFRFDGTAYGAFTEDENGKIIPDTTKPLTMITINLTGDLKEAASDPDNVDLNSAITNWRLLVNGVETTYGAPSVFDNGNLYLWLPSDDAKKMVTVDLSFLGPDGSIIPVEPLYREPGSNEKLKRYVYFELPVGTVEEGAFFTDAKGHYSTVIVPFDQLDLEEQRKVSKDENGNAEVKSITKPYDGLPYSVRKLTEDNPLNTGGNDNRKLFGDVEYICQTLDPETKKLSEQVTLANMPEDAGLSRFILESKQYADASKYPDFAESYWGHRAYGWCEITPVDPAIVSLEASWLDASGNLIDPDEKNTVANTLKLVADITSAEGTANTCKAPTGWMQIVVDGEKVGEPIPIIYEGEGDGANTVKTTTKISTRSAQSAPARQMMRAAAANAPAFAAAATPAATAETGIAAQADDWNDGYDGTREHGIFTVTLNATDDGCDWLIPNATADNKHTVSLEYIPAKNYNSTEGLAQDKKPQVEVEAEPIPPATDSEVETPGVVDKKDPQPGDAENRIERHKLTYDYKDPKKDTGATPDPNWNVLTIKVDSPSSGDFTIKTTNGAVATAEILRDSNNNPIKDADGKYTLRIKVDSAGETTITVDQKPNGVYYGSTFIYDLTVEPDVTIPPETSIVKTAKNLTREGDYIRPGDIIEYTITAANAAKGSVWQFPYMQDQLPQTVELVPGSLKLTNTSLSIMEPKTLSESEYTFEDGKITVPLTRIYGGQSAQLTFQAKVKDGLANRDAPDELKTVANDAQAQGYTGMENKPIPGGGYERPTDPGNPFDDPADPDDPDNPTDPDDPDNPGTTPDPDAPKKTPVVETEEPGRPNVDLIIPKDVQKGDITVVKTASNLTRQSGSTQVGDKIAYSITVANVKPDSVWCDTVIKDQLPAGIEPVAGTFKLKTATGEEKAVADAVYYKAQRTISLTVGTLYGGESATLTFQAEVTKDAIGKDIGNIAEVYGSQPKQKLPDPKDVDPKDPNLPANKPGNNGGDDPDDPDNPGGNPDNPDNPGTDPDNPDNPGTDPDDPDNPNTPGTNPGPKDPFSLDDGPEPGAPFWPEGTWEEFEETHSLPIDANNPAGGVVKAVNETPAYPLPQDAIDKAIADPNGGANNVGKKLPRTGDETSIPAGAAAFGMLAALAVALYARHRKNEAARM